MIRSVRKSFFLPSLVLVPMAAAAVGAASMVASAPLIAANSLPIELLPAIYTFSPLFLPAVVAYFYPDRAILIGLVMGTLFVLMPLALMIGLTDAGWSVENSSVTVIGLTGPLGFVVVVLLWVLTAKIGSRVRRRHSSSQM